MPSVLKFGIICGDASIPQWQAECIRQLVESGTAEPALFVIEQEPSLPRRRFGTAGAVLFRAWRRAVVHPRVPSLRPDRLADAVPVRRVMPREDIDGMRHYPAADIAAIGACRLDFIIRFKPSGLAGGVLETARWGIWSYSHGDGHAYRNTPPGFWELLRDDPVQEVTLERIAGGSAGAVILHRGAFRARPTYARHLHAFLLGSADWAARVARELDLDEAKAFATPTAPAAARGPPTNRAFLLYLTKRAVAIARGAARKLLRREDWNIGIIDKPLAELVRGGRAPSVAWFPEPPAGGFLADPFPLKCRGAVYVLAEEYDRRTGKGHIAAARMVDGKFVAGLSTVLRSPHHLSYPFLFRWAGETYCVPERSEGGGVPLYRAIRLPDEWEHVRTLIEGFPALDSTIFEHGGHWWLFCTRAGALSEYKLHAWHAATPLGPWTPHALNPLKCDVRSSRPAGPAFTIGRELYRPAQDGSRTYGGAITFNRVKTLTPTRFEEEAVGTLAPDPAGRYPAGLHTICDIGGLTVVDGKRYQTVSPLRRLWPPPLLRQST
jgi:hypothetical protein